MAEASTSASAVSEQQPASTSDEDTRVHGSANSSATHGEESTQAPALERADASEAAPDTNTTHPSTDAPIDLTTMDFSDAAAGGGSSMPEHPKDRTAAAEHKATGNKHFAAREFSEAIEEYSTALDFAPLDTPQDHKDASVYYANRAACFMGLSAWEDAARDCSDALELAPEYAKARLRRAHAYEKMEKLDEALADYKRLLELQPGMPEAARAVPRLERAIAARDEQLKEEMMGKLKDLGNSILGNFGLSTDNFQFKQDPNTGGYNINFVQNNEQGPAK